MADKIAQIFDIPHGSQGAFLKVLLEYLDKHLELLAKNPPQQIELQYYHPLVH